LEHPPNPHRKPKYPHPRPLRLTDGLGVTFSEVIWFRWVVDISTRAAI
jgi:hypothetical protein